MSPDTVRLCEHAREAAVGDKVSIVALERVELHEAALARSCESNARLGQRERELLARAAEPQELVEGAVVVARASAQLEVPEACRHRLSVAGRELLRRQRHVEDANVIVRGPALQMPQLGEAGRDELVLCEHERRERDASSSVASACCLRN